MMTIARTLAALALSVAASSFALAQPKATGGPTPSPEGAASYFVDLKDGAVIGAQTTVHFGLRGMGVAPAGSEKVNSGHHHLLIDAELPPLDEPIPNDVNHMHFGAGQTEVDLALTPGPHTLQLLLGDKNHVPHSPPVMSERIHVTVGDAAAAPSPPPAEATRTTTPTEPATPAPAPTAGRRPSPSDAKAYIIAPENGDAVPLTLLVRFGLDNMAVVRAGVDAPNSGHHHLLIDAPLPPLDEPIPNDENHLHFGAGQTEATITLTPGKHTLQLLVGDAHHMPHDPPVFSAPITVVAGETPATSERKTCKPNETLDSSGACAPRPAARAPIKPPAPHREVTRPPRRHEAAPVRAPEPAPPHPVAHAPRHAPARERERERFSPEAPAAPEPDQGFNDLRHCPPGTHSQSAPSVTGFRCVPNS
jgi:hypothetical protein